MNDIQKAKEILEKGAFTCVLVSKEEVISFSERGVKPLLSLLNEERNMANFCAADKVVGKAAAFLYLLLGVKTIYASVISEHALALLHENGVCVSYDTLVPMIRNRTDTGFCPMESATLTCHTPHEALGKIKETLEKLKTPF